MELEQKHEELLRARAKRLAERHSGAAEKRDLCRVMVVLVGGSAYAVPLEQVTEVRPLRERVAVPGAPRDCLGLVNVRSELRAVIDLGILLGSAEPGSDGFLIFPRKEVTGGRQIGLRVDALSDVYDLDRGTVGPVVSSGSAAHPARKGVDERGNSFLDLKFLFLGNGEDER